MSISKQELENILSINSAKIYFVGIGGIAMSAAANIAKNFGYEVLGSDSKELYSPAKDVLEKNIIRYFQGYEAAHIVESKADLFVISAGENISNSEVKYIYDNGLPHVGFAELLYELSKNSLRMVVAGTHGKSTTSGLLGHLVKNLDNSSFMAGALLQNYQSNFYIGDGHYFVFEGDEYKEEFDDPTPKFQYYKADVLVLTNLEYDHPDLYASLEDLEKEFELLIENMPADGLIVYNADDPNLSKLVHKSNISCVSFAIDNEADFKVDSINYGSDFTEIRVINKFSAEMLEKLLETTEDYQIQLPGKINVYNALAAIATLRTLGFSRENLALDVISYKGVKRRFEVVGVKNGITIIDDYAHHPTAVKETLEAARLRYFGVPPSPLARGEAPSASEGQRGRNVSTPKLWAIFEPHTFSRTKAVFPELIKAFDSADEVLISEIYPAREKATEATITSQEVIKAILSNQSLGSLPVGAAISRPYNVRLVPSKQEALDIVKKEAKSGDVIVVMAVGSFNRLAYELKEIL